MGSGAVLKYVPIFGDAIERHLELGWILDDALVGTHHGWHAMLMVLPAETKTKGPARKLAP